MDLDSLLDGLDLFLGSNLLEELMLILSGASMAVGTKSIFIYYYNFSWAKLPGVSTRPRGSLAFQGLVGDSSGLITVKSLGELPLEALAVF